MNTQLVLCLAMLLLWNYGCRQTDKIASNYNNAVINYEQLDLKKAETIVQAVCHNCHDPSAGKTNRIAPPLELAKRNYLAVTNNEEEFVHKMVRFIMHPAEEQAELHQDVEEYGLMDPLGYSLTDIQSVAVYIYRTELERPDWVDDEGDQE